MQKVSARKLSVLGMVLMAASAVTAAVLPTKSNDAKQVNSVDNATLVSNSGLTPGAGGIRSCIADQQGDVVFSCHLTVNSATGGASEVLGNRTAGNTSNSQSGEDHEGDTTSVVS